MIVLDTNVLSEEMKPIPAQNVHDWFAQQGAADLYTTAVTEAEILYGIAVLPDGKRKRVLDAAAHAVLTLFEGRILPFDRAAAQAFARIVSQRRAIGKPINDFDAQIAAITQSREMTLATRNVTDFEGLDLLVINPWGR